MIILTIMNYRIYKYVTIAYFKNLRLQIQRRSIHVCRHTKISKFITINNL